MPPMSEDSAALLLEGHPDPALVVDAIGGVRWMNAAAQSRLPMPVLGLDALGLTLSDLERARASAQDVRIAGQDAVVATWRLRVGAPVSGRRLVTLTPVDDLCGYADQARQLAERLDVAQEFGRLGVWERDLKTLTGHWDRHAFRIWGLNESAGTPHFAVAAQAIVDEDREALQKAFHASTQQAGTYSHRYRLRQPDGTLRRVHSQWIILDGPDGRPQRAVGVMMDDTEAWDLARSHDAALMQLAVAVEVGQIAIWRRRIDSRHVHCNDVGLRLLGFEPSADGHTVDAMMARLHPDDAGLMRAAARQALNLREPVDFEARLRRFDGHWRHVHTRLVVERDGAGEPLEFFGVSLDITRRRDDARRARELLRRFNLAARTAGIGHWSLEQGAERSRWSEQLYVLHGLPIGGTVPKLGEWIATHVHPDDRETVVQSYRNWSHSGRPAHEIQFRLVRSDGAVLHVITHSHIESTGDKSLVFGIVIDVTERRAAETALRQAAERAALIANGVGLGTWELDIATGDAVWDEQMFRLRGLAPGPRALTNDERIALVHADDSETVRTITARMQVDTGPIDFEFRTVWPDGSAHWLASRSSAVCDADGRPVRRIGVNWDVTDARSAVAEREERLAAQREVRAKSQFLSRMSHELRTPLNAVLGFTQLLLDESKAVDLATRKRRLEHIRSAGQHLLSLIDDVLDLSQLEGGEVAIELQPVPLVPLTQGLLPLVEPLARQIGVQVRTAALDGVPLADPTRLRQVLLNLLTNAIKYNRDGGEVVLAANAADGVVALSVSDTGRGMTPQQMLHLFEPFNRLGAESLGVEGTGIGLAIVKALVERMGGTVHVESAIDRGTRFEMRLRDGHGIGPAPHELVSPQALALAATSGRVGRGGTVLYIEDNAVNTLIVGELIAQRSDLKMLSAETGAGGCEIARSARPHLVLLDMQLPDIDGFEVFKRLRADPRTARIPCIALSANAMPDDIERALRAGFADYWTKPLDFRTFMASIEALFGPAP